MQRTTWAAEEIATRHYRGRVFSTENLPVRRSAGELGLITAPAERPTVHRNTTGGLYETRATITPVRLPADVPNGCAYLL